jgi:zinc and cadmium transporter
MHPLDIHWVYTFGSVALIAGLALLGRLALTFSPKNLSVVIPLLVSVAAGALLGTAFCHLLPESVKQVGDGPKLSALLMGGFVIFFVLEKLLSVWCNRSSGELGDAEIHQHHRGIDFDQAAHFHAPGSSAGNGPMVTNLMFGAAIHSFVDGMTIATGYIVDTRLGVITTIAVFFHEVPHHIGDVSIMIHKGVPIIRAVLLSFLAGSGAALGALLVLLIGEQVTGVTTLLLPFATANFLYIASANLMPELRDETRLRPSLVQILLFGAGCSLMFALGA